MKVIVLAAGRSKRLKPIEDKNFLEFFGKPLLEHQLEQLKAAGFKDIVVVGGAHNLAKLRQLARRFAGGFAVAEQKDLNDGMAGAILAVEKLVKKAPVLIVSANDVVDANIYKEILEAAKKAEFESFIVGKKMQNYFPGGYLKVNTKGQISGIVEKPRPGTEPSKYVNLVVHYHKNSAALFEALHKVKSKKDDRYEVALSHLITEGINMKMIPYKGFWLPIKYPWHILDVMEHFLESACGLNPTGAGSPLLGEEHMRSPKSAASRHIEIAKTATLRGHVMLEEGVKIFDNAVIVGPTYIGKNTIIATNAMVRGSHIGDNCVIGSGSEITRSYVGNRVWTHTNYVGDSVIGNNCSFGAGTVIGNLRLDEGNIKVQIQGEKIDSNRSKLGIIMGENVRCGINSSLMPGIKIGDNCFIGAGIVIAQDIEDNSYVYGKTELIIKKNISTLNSKMREEMKKKLRS